MRQLLGFCCQNQLVIQDVGINSRLSPCWSCRFAATIIPSTTIVDGIKNTISTGGPTAEARVLVTRIAAHFLPSAPSACFEEPDRNILRSVDDLRSSFAHCTQRHPYIDDKQSKLVSRIRKPYQATQTICSNCGLSKINLMSRLFADDRTT